MRTGARILGVAVAAALIVPLSACVGGADPIPTVVVDMVGIPAQLAPQHPLIEQGGELLPATGDLPLAFGGAITEPDGVASPVVWVSSDGSSWQRAVVDPEVEGSFSGSLAGSAERAVLGGVVWQDRAYRSVLWSSDDRVRWQPVTLPDTFLSTYRLSMLAVVDSHAYGIGLSSHGDAAGFVVVDDGVTDLNLPTLGEGILLNPLALTGTGESLLLVASPSPEGEYAPVVSFVSTDRGASWSGPVELAESASSIAGVVWSGTEYVATGSNPRSEAAGASYRAASWVSTDGSSWSKEAVPAPPDSSPFYLLDAADAWFGAPTASDGIVTVISSNINSAVSALYTRAASGTWTYSGVTSANETNGESGRAASLPEGAAGGATAVAILASNGHLRTGTFAGSSYTDVTTLARRDVVAYVNSAYPDSDSVDFVLRQRVFTVADDLGWRNTSNYTLASYSGGEVATITPWDPEAVGELLTVTMATDASGAQIITGSRFPEGQSTILAQGFHRSSESADWVPMSGFGTDGSTEFYALVSTSDGWVAVGDYRSSTNAGTPSHATAWRSSDGIAWSRDNGDFGDGRLETSLADVCVLPDGKPIGVGWAEVNTGTYRAAAWSPTAGSWERHALGEFGELEGYATSCANDNDGVVVSASIGGRSVLLRTTTGSDWRQVFRAEKGATLTDPVAVSGGFAAAGWWSNDTSAGPVVWLSRDGIQWVPVAIPSRNPASTYLVAPVGDDLAVALPATSAHPLVVVRDIARVINDLVPAGE